MTFKIRITGVAELLKLIHSTRQYQKRANQILQQLNATNITRKVQKSVRNEMRDAGFNEKGQRSKEIIAGFGVDKMNGVRRSAKGLSRTFKIHKPVGDRKIVFEHKNSFFTGEMSKNQPDSELILNFMTGYRKGYTIPVAEGEGRLVFKNRRGGKKFTVLPKRHLYGVRPHTGRANFDYNIEVVMSEWLDGIAEKMKAEQEKI